MGRKKKPTQNSAGYVNKCDAVPQSGHLRDILGKVSEKSGVQIPTRGMRGKDTGKGLTVLPLPTCNGQGLSQRTPPGGGGGPASRLEKGRREKG